MLGGRSLGKDSDCLRLKDDHERPTLSAKDSFGRLFVPIIPAEWEVGDIAPMSVAEVIAAASFSSIA